MCEIATNETIGIPFEEFYEANNDLIHFVLHKKFKMHKGFNNYEDCFQEGFFGFVQAYRNFDAALGNKFSTYAVISITESIKRFRYKQGSSLKIPRSFYEVWYHVKDDGTFDVNEILKSTSHSKKLVEEAIAKYETRSSSSLDFERNSDDSSNVGKFIESFGYEDDYSMVELFDQLNNNFDDKSRKVLLYRSQGYDQREIAVKVGVSQPHVSRIIAKAKKQFSQVS